MREELIPLFPLPLVLFPRTPLPLHIFEERYKEMIGEAIDKESEFGIVLVREGGVVNTGCTAVVAKLLERYSDGRMDILTTGLRRFEIKQLVEGKPYLEGQVVYFDDEDFEPVPPELRQKAIELYSSARKATDEEPNDELEWDDPQVSFQLAHLITDLDVRQQLLTLRSETERLKHLIGQFPAHIDRWRHTQRVRELAPRNGHSKGMPAL